MAPGGSIAYTITVNCLRDHWRTENTQQPRAACHVWGMIEELEDGQSELSQLWNQEHSHYMVELLLKAAESDFEPRTIEIFRRLALSKVPVDAVAHEFKTTPNACFIARSRVMKRLKELSREKFGSHDALASS